LLQDTDSLDPSKGGVVSHEASHQMEPPTHSSVMLMTPSRHQRSSESIEMPSAEITVRHEPLHSPKPVIASLGDETLATTPKSSGLAQLFPEDPFAKATPKKKGKKKKGIVVDFDKEEHDIEARISMLVGDKDHNTSQSSITQPVVSASTSTDNRAQPHSLQSDSVLTHTVQAQSTPVQLVLPSPVPPLTAAVIHHSDPHHNQPPVSVATSISETRNSKEDVTATTSTSPQILPSIPSTHAPLPPTGLGPSQITHQEHAAAEELRKIEAELAQQQLLQQKLRQRQLDLQRRKQQQEQSLLNAASLQIDGNVQKPNLPQKTSSSQESMARSASPATIAQELLLVTAKPTILSAAVTQSALTSSSVLSPQIASDVTRPVTSSPPKDTLLSNTSSDFPRDLLISTNNGNRADIPAVKSSESKGSKSSLWNDDDDLSFGPKPSVTPMVGGNHGSLSTLPNPTLAAPAKWDDDFVPGPAKGPSEATSEMGTTPPKFQANQGSLSDARSSSFRTFFSGICLTFLCFSTFSYMRIQKLTLCHNRGSHLWHQISNS
jgi:hypothetical protein